MTAWTFPVAFIASIFFLHLWLSIKAYLARRNERQVEDEQILKRGFKCAERLGLIHEDTQ